MPKAETRHLRWYSQKRPHKGTYIFRKLSPSDANCRYPLLTGYTPLHEAAAGGHTQIVQTLLAYGASPDFKASKGAPSEVLRPLITRT